MRRQKVRGATRMKEFGYKQVALWLSPKEYAAIEKAAREAGLRPGTYIRKTSVEAAGGQFIYR